jgi:dipeptidyl aminopeptidase/acylaminoacyl peptidase
LTGPSVASIKILDIASKKAVSIAQPSGIVFDANFRGRTDLAWLPGGSYLLVLYYKAHSDRGQIGIVGVSGGDFHTLTNDVNAYSELAVSADGRTLATVLTNVDSSLAYYKADGGAMISSTPLRITPSSLAFADEDHVFLITRSIGISKLERTTGTLQPIDTGDLGIGKYINICQDGHVIFTAFPKGGGESRLFRMDGDGSEITQLTTTGIARDPFCTPDSRKVYFTIRDIVNLSLLSLWSVPLSGGAPQKELEIPFQISVVLSRDAKLAAAVLSRNNVYYVEIWDLTTGRMVHRLPAELSSFQGSFPIFSPDARAIVEGVTSNGSNALRYQPIDGSPAHFLTDPTPDGLTAFAYSPSGSKLGVLQLRKSSDVVLITDLTGKQQH